MFDWTDLSLAYGNQEEQSISPKQEQPKIQQVQVPPDVEYIPNEDMYATEKTQQRQVYRDPSFFDKLGDVKIEVLKLVVFALIILLAIAFDKAIFYYIKTYIDENILSWYQEFFLRFAYPISVLVIIWFIKASW